MSLQSLVQLILPLVFIVSVVSSRNAIRREWLLNLLPLVAGVLFLLVSLPWHLTSAYLRWLWALLLLVALVYSYRQIGKPGSPLVPGWQNVLNVVIALVLGGLVLAGLRGYLRPARAVNLAMPLEAGVYFVGNGGDSMLVNGHQAAYTQRYAVDFVGLGPWGNSRTFSQPGLEDYSIFGAGIISPCAGTVLSAVDQFPDLPIGVQDSKNLAGNHVVVECDGLTVLLAHMQAGSVQVSADAVVQAGQLLGRVGNSGNSSEPHLHIHAASGSLSPMLLDGEPVAITFDGRFLVRNQIVSME